MEIKRWIAGFLALALSLSLLAGCNHSEDEQRLQAEVVDQKGDIGNAFPSEEQGQSSSSEKNDSSSDEQSSKEQGFLSDNEALLHGEKDEMRDDEATFSGGGQFSESNLFRVETYNAALNLKGQKISDQNRCISAPISAAAGDRLSIGPISPAQVVVGFCYDQNGAPLELINAHKMKGGDTFSGGCRIYTYTVPKKGAVVRFCVESKNQASTVVLRNQELSRSALEDEIGSGGVAVGDCLFSKRGLFVGDSICYGLHDSKGGGWAGRISERAEFEAINRAVSGASFSPCRVERIKAQILIDKNEDFDYVLLHGGVNDAWSNVPIGEISEEYAPLNFNENTFAGALEEAIYYAILYYGDTASIGFLINFKLPAADVGRCADMSEYVAMAKQICEKWGITYFDMYHHNQINQELAYDTDRHTSDYIHPLASGYEVITPYIESYIREMTPCAEQVLKEVLG